MLQVLENSGESSFNEKQNCTDLKIHYKVKYTFKLMSWFNIAFSVYLHSLVLLDYLCYSSRVQSLDREVSDTTSVCFMYAVREVLINLIFFSIFTASCWQRKGHKAQWDASAQPPLLARLLLRLALCPLGLPLLLNGAQRCHLLQTPGTRVRTPAGTRTPVSLLGAPEATRHLQHHLPYL